MQERYEAQLTIESRIGEEVFEMTAESAAVYRKRGGWYFRYIEKDDEGHITTTVVKLGDKEWTVRRSGAVESQMVFKLNEAREGYYRSSGIELRVTTVMRSSYFEFVEGKGRVSWDYDLLIGGEPVERHHIIYKME